MKQITRAEQDRLLEVMGRHRAALMRHPNVHGVDVGYEFAGGRPTERLAIRVHVDTKQPEADLAPGEVVPDEVEGIPVDVIQSNPELHLVNRNAHQTPVIGGVTIANTRMLGFVGTLGGVVFDQSSLEPLGISNYHVMVVGTAQTADTIAQPNSAAPADALGNLVRWDQPTDCAVCRISSRTVSTDLADLGSPTAIFAPLVGMRVVKSGRSTGVTRGVIDGTSSGEFTIVPDPDVPAPGGEISAPGDSGSLWLEASSRGAVGLHFAGETDPDPTAERAWAKWMPTVADKLSIRVIDRAAMGFASTGWSCTVLARTRPNAPCHLAITYPSGRKSSAKGLGAQVSGPDGWVRWRWIVGSSTKRHGAGTGNPLGNPIVGTVTLDGSVVQVTAPLHGNPTT